MPPKMTYLCELCRHSTELMYCRATDQYLCEECIVNLAHAHFEANRDDEVTLVPLRTPR